MSIEVLERGVGEKCWREVLERIVGADVSPAKIKSAPTMWLLLRRGHCTVLNLSAEQQAELLTGHALAEGSVPFAQAYAGHQFGGFSILGDGRAHVLGEHLTPSGQRVEEVHQSVLRTSQEDPPVMVPTAFSAGHGGP